MANSNAGTSSGSAEGGQYQVFLNFHGRDTRLGFTGFLYRDLTKNGIHAFMDDEELQVGEEIGGQLLRAIDDSRIYIPIFSQNYASSKWCLRELARIVHNTTTKSEEKKIMPIFFNVDPDDVALKTPLYRTTIEKHKEEHKEFLHEVESWEEALKRVAKIKGWVLPKGENQAELVDLVVENVLWELKIRYEPLTENLVGLDDQVYEVLELLDINCSDEVRLLEIHGMGGIGKTTIATVVYNELSSSFGKCRAFLDDIRETAKEGLLSLQKKLLKEIDSYGAAANIENVDQGRERMEATLGSKKVLIVLDGVDEKEQIENLIGRGRMHPGTRIIITTRNKGVLIEQRMAREMQEVNSNHALQILYYEMKGLIFDHALQLFKMHAFGERHAFGEDSSAKDFDSLSIEIVKTIGGLPLALTVVGSLLNDEDKVTWKEALGKLKDMPGDNVREKLMISYDALNSRQREIFLDVACFFIDEYITNPIYMWDDCKFYPNMEIGVLVRRSLIKIQDNKFLMHNQLRDLGREIVRQGNSENLEKWSRVWTSDEFDFVGTKERYEDVKALDLQWRDISIGHEEIRRFKSLRFLRLSYGAIRGDFTVSLPKLRWISWRVAFRDVCGLSMHSKNLVVLELFDNLFTNDSKVWDSLKMANKLKSLALVECRGITRTPDLSECLALERVTFDDCRSLMVIDNSIAKLTCLLDLDITRCGLVERVPNEIGRLQKLEHFSLKSCYKVGGLPTSIGNLASLRKLDLSMTGITSLPYSIGKLKHLIDLNLLGLGITELPNTIEGLGKLQRLCLKDTKIRQLPNSIKKLTSLCTLDLSKHKTEGNIDPWELPRAIGMLEKLEELFLRHRNDLVGEIPNEIGYLSYLRVLDLYGTRICQVPSKINMLSCLLILDLTHCDNIKELPQLPTSLVCLRVESQALEVVPNLSELTNLKELFLSDGSGSHLRRSSNLRHMGDLRWIESLSKLEKLKLYLINAAAPDPLPRPKNHDLCWQLPSSLLSLELSDFSLTGSLLSNLKILSDLTLRFSQMQEIRLDGLLELRYLELESCDLQSLAIPSSLRILRVFYCPNMIEIQFLRTSASLEVLTIENCMSIGRIVLGGEVGSLRVLNLLESSSRESTYCSSTVLPNALKKLEKLRLKGCKNLLEIQVIGTLFSLQDIYIEDCHAMEKLSGVLNLKNLQSLKIYYCPKLWFVEGLDELEFSTNLRVSGCPSLETLLDRSNSKILEMCITKVSQCRESLNSSSEGFITFKRYKEMAQQGAPQPETNKGLDELAPPRTFCDRFKTCLVSILECVCNCDFPSVRAEIL